MITRVKKKSITAMQPGKSTPAEVKTFNVSTVMAQFKNPMKNATGDSVLGASHDFRSVGSAAI